MQKFLQGTQQAPPGHGYQRRFSLERLRLADSLIARLCEETGEVAKSGPAALAKAVGAP